MNKDLKDLAQIIDSLPENIGHISCFNDSKSNEFIFTCNTEGYNPFEKVSNLYKEHVEEGIIDNTMELFRANLYALFFAFAEQEGYDDLLKIRDSIDVIIENW